MTFVPVMGCCKLFCKTTKICPPNKLTIKILNVMVTYSCNLGLFHNTTVDQYFVTFCCPASAIVVLSICKQCSILMDVTDMISSGESSLRALHPHQLQVGGELHVRCRIMNCMMKQNENSDETKWKASIIFSAQFKMLDTRYTFNDHCMKLHVQTTDTIILHVFTLGACGLPANM